MNPSDELKANREEIRQVTEKIELVNGKIERAILGTGEYTDVAQEKIDLVLVELRSQLAELRSQLAELRSDKQKWSELVKEQIRKSIFIFAKQ
jgi:predicted nuclease with TOPRIM domain